MRRSSAVCETLESRVLLSASASSVLNKAARADLLFDWAGPHKPTLTKDLKAKKYGKFDNLLLNYMETRAGTYFFWKTSDVNSIRNFINTNLATSSTISNADHVVNHQFPNGNSASYSVQLGSGDINWKTTTSNPEFVYTLNRQDFWVDLAQSYVLTGNNKYVNEMISELSSWSAQNPAPLDANSWSDAGAAWQPLTVGMRVDNWIWAYQMVLGSSAWTPAANTLFLEELNQQGDFLRKVQPYALSSNRSLFEAQGLLEISHIASELTDAYNWQLYSRRVLFGAMDGQLNADGGHVEASPGYAGAVISSLLEMYSLDRRTGHGSAWKKSRRTKLKNAAKSYVQLLSPDGKTAALSDTYRTTTAPFMDRPRIILNDPADFPAAKPRLRDVWLFGTDLAGSLLGAPITPALPDRGKIYSMPYSGYYVMRSGSDTNATQLTFDAGPTGGEFHGHLDLLNFELFGYRQPLISDPGVYQYDTSARRAWAISTPAHNTISIDGKSHDAIDVIKNGNIASTGIYASAGGYQITASHKAYGRLDGSPAVTRSIWTDGNGTFLIADSVAASSTHTYTQSFLLPGTKTSRDLSAGWIHSNNGYGNVKIQSLLQPKQSAHIVTKIPGTTLNVFTSNDPDGGVANPATQYTVNERGTSAVFVTLITTYGNAVPNTTAKIVKNKHKGGGFYVQIFRNGATSEKVPFFIKSK